MIEHNPQLIGRETSAMYADGKCVVCGAPKTAAPGHLLQHLQDASAIVDTGAIVPNEPANKKLELPKDFFRARDPVLRRIANNALARSLAALKKQGDA